MIDVKKKMYERLPGETLILEYYRSNAKN